ncbi:MAG: hypothetical protein IKZ19_00450, partial [Clostridia bacterium]|nr:hypothetical protein [Clostridia bacterium]
MNGKFGSIISGKTLKKKLLLYSGIFAVSLGLCGVSFYGVLAPVGICFQGCFAGRRRMFFSFLGVIIGSCIFGFAPVKYIAVSLIVLVMNEAFLNLADIKKPVFACFGVTGAMGLIGLITLISPDNEMAGLMYIAELIICAMLTALFFGVVGGDGILDKKGG